MKQPSALQPTKLVSRFTTGLALASVTTFATLPAQAGVSAEEAKRIGEEIGRLVGEQVGREVGETVARATLEQIKAGRSPDNIDFSGSGLAMNADTSQASSGDRTTTDSFESSFADISETMESSAKDSMDDDFLSASNDSDDFDTSFEDGQEDSSDSAPSWEDSSNDSDSFAAADPDSSMEGEQTSQASRGSDGEDYSKPDGLASANKVEREYAHAINLKPWWIQPGGNLREDLALEFAGHMEKSGSDNVMLGLKFSGPLASADVVNSNVQVLDVKGNKVSGSWSLAKNPAVTFFSNLSGGRYTVVVSGDIKDKNGKKLRNPVQGAVYMPSQ